MDSPLDLIEISEVTPTRFGRRRIIRLIAGGSLAGQLADVITVSRSLSFGGSHVRLDAGHTIIEGHLTRDETVALAMALLDTLRESAEVEAEGE